MRPSYSGSRYRLFELLRRNDRWDEAEKVLFDSVHEIDPPVVLLAKIETHAHRERWTAADELLDELFRVNEGYSGDIILRSRLFYEEAGRESVWKQRIQDSLDEPDNRKMIGYMWAETCLIDATQKDQESLVKQLVDRAKSEMEGQDTSSGTPNLGKAIFARVLCFLSEQSRTKTYVKFLEQHARSSNLPWTWIPKSWICMFVTAPHFPVHSLVNG